jgi:hypothetical protein
MLVVEAELIGQRAHHAGVMCHADEPTGSENKGELHDDVTARKCCR